MSSHEYSTVLHPEPRLRSAVLLSGALAGVAGVVLIAMLPAAGHLQVPVALGWIILTIRQLLVLVRGFRHCCSVRVLPDGAVQITRRDGRRVPGRILAGSLVLARVAWLRIEVIEGRRWAEPVRGNARESGAWRRFQVIWRHLGSAV